jgi:hypothetical protein
LPIWIEFMRQALAGGTDEPFPATPGITTVPIDPRTGKRPSLRAGCEGYAIESFIEGTEPSELCSRELHRRLALPYPFQRYDLAADGSLRIPYDELSALLAREQDVIFEPDSGEVVAFDRDGPARLVVTALPEAEAPERELPADLREEAEHWVGTDGRRARTVWFRNGDR